MLKYFGRVQGVSAYTFIDGCGFLWYSLVFSAAERESAYVIDGLMHNNFVQSDIHATDRMCHAPRHILPAEGRMPLHQQQFL